MPRRLPAAYCIAALLASAPLAQAATPSLAFFGFTLDNTSPADSTAEELARTKRMGRDLAAALQKSGKYVLLDTAPVEASLQAQSEIRGCNGCELPAAQKLGANLAGYGWVQKVSNLILNLNLVIEDAKTGKMVAAGSVDIRGNTDESWDHGLKFLLEEHVFNR